ncbi:hypothetical protein [Kitasatospora purpeofusca]|uniref:hypothetical protein n=1 Tax=Kitasatospora purpeofusca TaxID=67352 RepID=UPI003657B6D3
MAHGSDCRQPLACHSGRSGIEEVGRGAGECGPVGLGIIDATARNIDDYAAGRRTGNTLVPKG